jgi:hypothetical protein
MGEEKRTNPLGRKATIDDIARVKARAQTPAPGDRSWPCALALAVLGRGRSNDTGETRSDYARKCAEAERTLIEADDDAVIDAVRTMSTGDTVKLVGRAVRMLASRRVVREEMVVTGVWVRRQTELAPVKRSPISQALITAQKAFDKASQALPEYEALQKAKAAWERLSASVIEARRFLRRIQALSAPNRATTPSRTRARLKGLILSEPIPRHRRGHSRV